MTSFLMSLNESVELILDAMKQWENGDLFVQKSPVATILTIYSTLSQLMGMDNLNIVKISNRPGEKMHETLLTTEGMFFSSSTDRYFQASKRDFIGSDSSVNCLEIILSSPLLIQNY